MFEGLSNKFSDVFGALRKKGRITESDIDATCEELRVALREVVLSKIRHTHLYCFVLADRLLHRFRRF